MRCHDWSIVCFGLDCLIFIEREIKPRLNVLACFVSSMLSALVVDFIDVVCY